MSDAHQRVRKGLWVHCTHFSVVHSLGQVTDISLANLAVVVEEGIWRDPFCLLDDAIDAPVPRHKGEECLKAAPLYLQTVALARDGGAHLRPQAFSNILDQFPEDLAPTMKVNALGSLRYAGAQG